MTEAGARSARFQVLGVRVDAVQLENVCAILEHWIRHRDRCRYVAVTGMHGVMEAQTDSSFRAVLNSADLVVPDGMPLVWLGRFRGQNLRRRVYGPELMLHVCQQTASRGWRHFLLGGEPGVPDRLATVVQSRFPGLQIAGTYSPPFRPLTEKEDEDLVETINRSSADVVWVGLSTPKQERWMHQHCHRLHAAVLLGVGAAFDILSETKKQAPGWMREGGLEWFFRLLQEPQRLWRRYLIYGPRFVYLVALELFGLRKFS